MLTTRSRAGRFGLAALAVVVGCESLENAVANGDTRTISMHHIHTKEDITITYKRNGRYDEEALKKLNWFLRDWRRQKSIEMDPKAIDTVWQAWRESGSTRPIEIVCGYRAPETNAMLRRRSKGVAKFSQHTLGKAIDFYIPGADLEEIRNSGLRMQRGGVGYYPTSGSPFVHLDSGNVRHWPHIGEEQMARILSRAPKVQVADDDQAKPGLLASLFRSGEDEDEGETTAAVAPTPAPARVAATPAPAPAAKTVASADKAAAPVEKPELRRTARDAQVPMPAARPAGAAVRIAAASPSSANAIIQSRGAWDSSPGGLKQVTVEGASFKVASAAEPVPAAPTDTAAAPESNQPVLAFAADRPASTDVSAARRMRVSFIKRAAAAEFDPIARVKTKIASAETGNDPWLRAMMLAPDLQNYMSTTMLGLPDAKELRALMRKPASALAMTFSDDPLAGVSIDRFTGDAIVFLPSVSFVTRTALLQQ